MLGELQGCLFLGNVRDEQFPPVTVNCVQELVYAIYGHINRKSLGRAGHEHLMRPGFDDRERMIIRIGDKKPIMRFIHS